MSSEQKINNDLNCSDCAQCIEMYHNGENKLYCIRHACVVFNDGEICNHYVG